MAVAPRSALALAGLWLQWGGAVADTSDNTENSDDSWMEWPPPADMLNCHPKLVQDQGKDPTQVTFDFDCKTWPLLCQPPFDCQKVTCDWVQDKGSPDHPWAPDGKHDLRLFCLSAGPRYGEYMTKCVGPNFDTVAAGKMQYKDSHELKHGPYTAEIDGSYCYQLALCDINEVSPETTVEEATEYCNREYGDAWHNIDFNLFKAAMDFKDPDNGFTNRTQSLLWAYFGCAMGNLHCDVIMCRETYCKEPYYMKKYGHLLERERKARAEQKGINEVEEKGHNEL